MNSDAILTLARRYAAHRALTLSTVSTKVPRRYRAGHPLSLLLVAEAATKLILRFGGTRLYIAKLDDPVRTRRNDEIIRSYEAGRSVARLAREYGLSERRIWEILKTPG